MREEVGTFTPLTYAVYTQLFFDDETASKVLFVDVVGGNPNKEGRNVEMYMDIYEKSTLLGYLPMTDYQQMLDNPGNYTLRLWTDDNDIDKWFLTIKDIQAEKDIFDSRNKPNIGGAKTKAAPKYKHQGRMYTLRTGSRGGKYIVCKGEKIYVR
jgi:hypothetical protein